MSYDDVIQFPVACSDRLVLEVSSESSMKNSARNKVIPMPERTNVQNSEHSINRRRFERKKVELTAYVGDPRWQRRNFKSVSIVDISVGGIQFTISTESHLNMQKEDDTVNFIVVFRLPNYSWPISLQIAPKRMLQYPHQICIGATFVKPDFNAVTALRHYMV